MIFCLIVCPLDIGQFKKAGFYIFLIYYSVLRATTGSFLAAMLLGINPAINVRPILIAIRPNP